MKKTLLGSLKVPSIPSHHCGIPWLHSLFTPPSTSSSSVQLNITNFPQFCCPRTNKSLQTFLLQSTDIMTKYKQSHLCNDAQIILFPPFLSASIDCLWLSCSSAPRSDRTTDRPPASLLGQKVLLPSIWFWQTRWLAAICPMEDDGPEEEHQNRLHNPY